MTADWQLILFDPFRVRNLCWDADPWALLTAIKSYAFGVKKIIADWQCPIAD
jgi:hypothetical protein